MPLYNYENLSWTDIDKLKRDKTLILVPIAPIEEHGPHLPLGVDYFNSEYFCRKAAELFLKNNPEYTILLYPPIPVGSDCFLFSGTIDIHQRAVYLIAKSMGKMLSKFGFKNIMFVGLHGGPRHIAALEGACRHLNRRYKMNALAPFGSVLIKMFTKRKFTQKLIGEELTDDKWYCFERDLHAGFIETSLMMHHKPSLVKDNYKYQKDFPLKLFEMRHHPFSRYDVWDGQLGYPSLASKEEGKKIADNMIKWFLGLMKDWAEGKNLKSYNKSLVSKALIFGVNFKYHITLFIIILCLLVIYLILR